MSHTDLDFFEQIIMSKYLWQFLWGLYGSFAIEMLAFTRAVSKHNGIPKEYPLFVIITKIAWFMIAGLTAVMLDANSFYNAVYCGASAPALFDRAAKGLE